MFAKHLSTKTISMYVSYHQPTIESPIIPDWYQSTSSESLQIPCTPSMPAPSQPDRTQDTQPTQTTTDKGGCDDEDKFLVNPT